MHKAIMRFNPKWFVVANPRECAKIAITTPKRPKIIRRIIEIFLTVDNAYANPFIIVTTDKNVFILN